MLDVNVGRSGKTPTNRHFLEVGQAAGTLGLLAGVGSDVFEGVELGEIALAGDGDVDEQRAVAHGAAVLAPLIHKLLLLGGGANEGMDLGGL